MGNPRPGAEMHEPIPSQAAMDYAVSQHAETNSITGFSDLCGHCRIAAQAYDAALATLQPRTIATEAELDALPGGAVVLGASDPRWAYQRAISVPAWYLGLRQESMSSAEVLRDGPLTLLAPVPAATPEPVRITPEDPRWRDGAKVRGKVEDGSAIEGILARGRATGEWLVLYLGECSTYTSHFTAVYLLAEAPDPRADLKLALVQAIDDANILTPSDAQLDDLINGLADRNWNITRRADS